MHKSRYIQLIVFIILLILISPVAAQDLEPRSLTNVPVGMNFGILGYGYSQGNILLDPALPIEDLNADVHAFVAGYVRAINFFGMAGKIDVLVPFATGNWQGNYEGNDTSTQRTGFGDPGFRLSVNFIGSPALKKEAYQNYTQKTIVGASIRVLAPLGEYYPSKLINLGSNRWSFKLKAGVSHKIKKWMLEAYLGGMFFTKNNNFFGGSELKQKPFFSGLLHVIYSLPKNMWLAANVGYGLGGRSIIDDVPKDTRMSTLRFGLTYALSFLKHHSLKLTIFSGVKFEQGPDIDSVVLVYSYRWIR